MIGGLIFVELPDGQLANYGLVGLFGFVVTLASLWLAGRLRVYDASVKSLDDTASVMAEAEANYVGEPIIGS